MCGNTVSFRVKKISSSFMGDEHGRYRKGGGFGDQIFPLRRVVEKAGNNHVHEACLA